MFKNSEILFYHKSI